MRKLTARQQRFCEEYKKDRDATQAALRAGYAKKQAAKMGAENLRKTHIQACLQEQREKREKSTIAGEEETLEYLTAVLRGEVEGIRASDQMKAAELFGRRYGLFSEKPRPEDEKKEGGESVEDYLRRLEEEKSF